MRTPTSAVLRAWTFRNFVLWKSIKIEKMTNFSIIVALQTVARSPKILCARAHDDKILSTKCFAPTECWVLFCQNFRVSTHPPPRKKFIFLKIQMLIFLLRSQKILKIKICDICIKNFMILNISVCVFPKIQKNYLKIGEFCKNGLFLI